MLNSSIYMQHGFRCYSALVGLSWLCSACPVHSRCAYAVMELISAWLSPYEESLAAPLAMEVPRWSFWHFDRTKCICIISKPKPVAWIPRPFHYSDKLLFFLFFFVVTAMLVSLEVEVWTSRTSTRSPWHFRRPNYCPVCHVVSVVCVTIGEGGSFVIGYHIVTRMY